MSMQTAGHRRRNWLPCWDFGGVQPATRRSSFNTSLWLHLLDLLHTATFQTDPLSKNGRSTVTDVLFYIFIFGETDRYAKFTDITHDISLLNKNHQLNAFNVKHSCRKCSVCIGIFFRNVTASITFVILQRNTKTRFFHIGWKATKS